MKRIASLLITSLVVAGCGGLEPDAGDEAAPPVPEDGERTTQGNGAGYPGYLFWHKAAYVLTDDRDEGYRTFTDELLPKLGKQQYLTLRVNKAGGIATVLADVKSKSMIVDTVLIVVNGHGGGVDYDSKGIFTSATEWRQHHVGIGGGGSNESITTLQLVDLMQQIRNMGKRVAIMDNSCQGGATVRYVEDRFGNDNQVCAIATTGTVTPSGVGFPRYQDVFGSLSYPDYRGLGLWASKQLTDVAHGTNGQPRNDRVHQYGYMNGCSTTMHLREGLAVAVSALTTWRTYNRKRHNHVFLNPERYLDRDPVNLADPGYAPSPDEAAANDGFNTYSVRDIDDLSKAAVELLFSSTPASAASAKLGVYKLVVNDVKSALKSWQNAYLWSSFVAETTKLCGTSLGKRIAALAKHPVCVTPWFPTTYSQAERDRLTKYYKLSCSNPGALVPEVLKDYPLLDTAIKNTKAAEQTARDTVRTASMYLYQQLEGQICQASGCDAINVF